MSELDNILELPDLPDPWSGLGRVPGTDGSVMIECAHRATTEILQPSEIIQAWGPSACSFIPVWPGYGRLHSTETADAVYLSKLTCGHYGMTSPTTIAAAEKKAADKAHKPSPLELLRLTLKLLLDKAHEGGEVTPAELAEAQGGDLLEEQAAAGRRERAEAARNKAEQAHRKTLEGPIRRGGRECRQHSGSRVTTRFFPSWPCWTPWRRTWKPRTTPGPL